MTDAKQRGEQMIISAPYIIFKLEGGAGNKTVPLIIAELDVQAEVKDWGSKVSVTYQKFLAMFVGVVALGYKYYAMVVWW